jgi:hypothetical protein
MAMKNPIISGKEAVPRCSLRKSKMIYRNISCIILILVFITLCGIPAFTSDLKDKQPQSNKVRMYEDDYLELLLMVHKSVKLPLEEYNILMEMVRKADERRKKELDEMNRLQAMASSEKYSITGGKLDCVISGDTATVTGSLGIDLNGKGWKEIPLYPLPGLESIFLGEREAVIQNVEEESNIEAYQVNTDEKGKKEIRFTFHPKINRISEGNTFYNTISMEFNQKAAFDVRITLPKGAEPAPGLSDKIKISKKGDLVLAFATTDFTEPLVFTWYVPRAKAAENLKPEYNGNLLSFFHFEKSRIRLVSLVNLEIITKAPEKIEISLPEGFNYNDSERAPGISVAPDGAGKIIVRIDSSFAGLAQFIFFADAPLEGTQAILLPPNVTGASRQDGWIAVGADGFSIKCSDNGDLVPSDTRLIPSEMRSMMDSLPEAAFKYTFSETVLKSAMLNLVSIKTADSLPAYIKELNFSSVYSQEGVMFTEARALLINNNTQFVKVSLPPASELQTAFVDDKPVKPVNDSDGALMIPIKPKENSQDGRVDVLFVFKTILPPMVDEGKAGIQLPSVNMPVNLMRFHLFLPEGFEYDSFESSMMPGEGLFRTTTTSGKQDSYKSISKGGQLNAPSSAEFEAGGSSIAGALSVRVIIPKTGSRHDFFDLLVMNEKPVLSFEYDKE